MRTMSFALWAIVIAGDAAAAAPHAGRLAAGPPPAASLSGRVTDSTGTPITGARVVVVEARRETRTDDSGRFSFGALPAGRYAVSVAAIGFRPSVQRVQLRDVPMMLEVVMAASRIELSEIQVTATADAGAAAQSPQPTSIVAADELPGGQTSSLGASLEGLPGVRNSATGQGIGKPVIRGLTSNRVVVIADGVRLENAQWGDEHGPQVETGDADRIEVIRGPASVLYGSDALGGVVNVVARELPDAIGRPAFASLRLAGGYGSAAAARDGGVTLEGARGGLGLRGSFVTRGSGDVATPRGRLFNSAARTSNVALDAGVRGGWGHAALSAVSRTERIEIHEDPAEDPTATVYQRVGEERVRADAGLPLGSFRLEMLAAWERNRRREFESETATDVALELTTTTFSSDIHLHHAPLAGWNGILGLSLLRGDITIGGEEVLVPASRYTNIGVLAFEQRDIGRIHASAGLRFDTRTLEVDDNADLGVSAQERSYRAFSANAGVLIPLVGPVSLVANAGRAWRAPSPFELFANGVHEGTVRFEVGDSALGVESSLNLDLALRWQSTTSRGEIGVFVNTITDYIYIQPTGQTDSASGFPIFRNVQGDAVLRGIEAAGMLHPTPWLELSAQADYTYGQNRSADAPLPLIPPLRVSSTVRLERGRHGAGGDFYASLTGVAVARTPATRLDPNDILTGAYELVHLGTGVKLLFGSRLIGLDLQIRNVLNRDYRDFLSRYKTYASDMGRNVVVRVTTEL